MNKQQLVDTIRKRRTFLCVGLDTDLKKVPAHILDMPDPIFAFNKAIIDATAQAQFGLLRMLRCDRLDSL